MGCGLSRAQDCDPILVPLGGAADINAADESAARLLCQDVIQACLSLAAVGALERIDSVAGQRLFITWKTLPFSRAHATRDSCGHLGSGPRCAAVCRTGVPSLEIRNQFCSTISIKVSTAKVRRFLKCGGIREAPLNHGLGHPRVPISATESVSTLHRFNATLEQIALP